MIDKRKICVVTGTRAEYGLLYWLMKEIDADPKLQLQVIVTGMHLSPEFNLTYTVIEEDGFQIDAKVEMLLSSDTPVGITKSIGLGVIGFADALDRLKPDILVLLGDRFEILAAAEAALIARIPVAHIAGGDITEGAFDDSIRHCITKMSHLHFVTNEAAARRVRQLGENPAHIFQVGSPGIDQIIRLNFLTRQELEKDLDFTFRQKNILITFHPETLERETIQHFQELLHALDLLGDEVVLVFTRPNADTLGKSINKILDNFVLRHSNAKVYTSLGQLRYLSLMKQVDVVVGNSSSGLYETPSFKIPTVNIGTRQKGRLEASSVINCPPDAIKILEAINEALGKDCSETVNPYGDGNSSEKILNVLKGFPNPQKLLKKRFYEVDFR